ncbi:MAG: 1,4-dihydroxy-2-naphthoate polyprenyltransferase [Thermomicrobiales bacterium]|jgi:1,4-dihydroxy-2-naphthoate polyprenyltransferase|nr:1,4-dihydroxy-2-naphthoate polyprenyltransferase [Thermomicrobiales bacterium]
MTSSLSAPTTTTAFGAWFLAVRPKTLPAAVSPVLVGCAVAWAADGFHLGTAIAAFAVALLLQIAANLANDVADFRRGADTAERLGPVRVTQSGLIRSERITMATAVVLVLAAIPGLYLVWRGGPLLAGLGLLAMLAAVAYTAGPKPFGYLGLGEVFVFLFFGPVAVIGTAYVMTGAASPLAVAASLPMGCLISAILVVNNLRDIDTDRAAGKHTLAVRMGREATRREYAALVAVAYAVPLATVLMGLAAPWVLLSWITAPLAMVLVRKVRTVPERALNPVLGGTARLCLWFAIALSVGIVL